MGRSDSTPAAIVANFAGRGVSGMASLLFVPVYLRLLGVEAYGLVGVYGILDCALRVLDLRLGEVVTRELAGLPSPAG
jgi:O-antigen/teichoic acid export membrane protein